MLQRIWTLPNAISMGRIAVTPLLGYFVAHNQTIPAICLFSACAVSDMADGWIARRFRQQSALGSILDPLGDKLLVGTLTVGLALSEQLPMWIVCLILGRDAVLVGMSFWVRWCSIPSPRSIFNFFDPSVATVTVRPTKISKINTFLQMTLLGGSLVAPMFKWISMFIWPLQWIVASSTIWSGFLYARDYRKVVRFIKDHK